MSSQPIDPQEVACALSGIVQMGTCVTEYWTWYPNKDLADTATDFAQTAHRWFCTQEQRKSCEGKKLCHCWGSEKGFKLCRKIKVEHTFVITEEPSE